MNEYGFDCPNCGTQYDLSKDQAEATKGFKCVRCGHYIETGRTEINSFGPRNALELIAENKRTRSPFLDLGNLGLAEVPAHQTSEVFETSEVLNPLP
ncbi:MAG: hypothetical protein HY842_20335 [Bacteroidetes bacterium]|nr:hypothetical protein [Bacteroidota bacterium]